MYYDMIGPKPQTIMCGPHTQVIHIYLPPLERTNLDHVNVCTFCISGQDHIKYDMKILAMRIGLSQTALVVKTLF